MANPEPYLAGEPPEPRAAAPAVEPGHTDSERWRLPALERLGRQIRDLATPPDGHDAPVWRDSLPPRPQQPR